MKIAKVARALIVPFVAIGVTNWFTWSMAYWAGQKSISQEYLVNYSCPLRNVVMRAQIEQALGLTEECKRAIAERSKQ